MRPVNKISTEEFWEFKDVTFYFFLSLSVCYLSFSTFHVFLLSMLFSCFSTYQFALEDPHSVYVEWMCIFVCQQREKCICLVINVFKIVYHCIIVPYSKFLLNGKNSYFLSFFNFLFTLYSYEVSVKMLKN